MIQMDDSLHQIKEKKCQCPSAVVDALIDFSDTLSHLDMPWLAQAKNSKHVPVAIDSNIQAYGRLYTN